MIMLNDRITLDCKSEYADGFFILTAPNMPKMLPAYFSVRFTVPDDYTGGDRLHIGDVEFAMVTIDSPETQAPGEIFANSVLVSMDVDIASGKGFLRQARGEVVNFPELNSREGLKQI